jgi:hypothetical protein
MNPGWKDYGGRGISMCSEWSDSFDSFLAHVGPRPSDRHSLDRIDNDGNYEPGNVRWATRKEQQANRRPMLKRKSPWIPDSSKFSKVKPRRSDSPRHYSNHGLSKTSEYRSWAMMKNRCFNQNSPGFEHYGGRGITVFEDWIFDFKKFFDYVGLKPSRLHSLDRIDNSGNYEPGNVRWATPIQQANNKRPYPELRAM